MSLKSARVTTMCHNPYSGVKTLDLVFTVHKRPTYNELVFYKRMRERKANKRTKLFKDYCTVTRYSSINLGSCVLKDRQSWEYLPILQLRSKTDHI